MRGVGTRGHEAPRDSWTRLDEPWGGVPNSITWLHIRLLWLLLLLLLLSMVLLKLLLQKLLVVQMLPLLPLLLQHLLLGRCEVTAFGKLLVQLLHGPHCLRPPNPLALKLTFSPRKQLADIVLLISLTHPLPGACPHLLCSARCPDHPWHVRAHLLPEGGRFGRRCVRPALHRQRPLARHAPALCRARTATWQRRANSTRATSHWQNSLSNTLDSNRSSLLP